MGDFIDTQRDCRVNQKLTLVTSLYEVVEVSQVKWNDSHWDTEEWGKRWMKLVTQDEMKYTRPSCLLFYFSSFMTWRAEAQGEPWGQKERKKQQMQSKFKWILVSTCRQVACITLQSCSHFQLSLSLTLSLTTFNLFLYWPGPVWWYLSQAKLYSHPGQEWEGEWNHEPSLMNWNETTTAPRCLMSVCVCVQKSAWL